MSLWQEPEHQIQSAHEWLPLVIQALFLRNTNYNVALPDDLARELATNLQNEFNRLMKELSEICGK